MRPFIALMLILSLVIPPRARAEGDRFSRYMEQVFSESQSPRDAVQELTRELNYHQLADNDDLMQAFTDALTNGENPTLVQNLAVQMEKNEATYIRLLEQLVEKARQNPEILKIAERNAARFTDMARETALPQVEVAGRVYEMAIFSLSYVSLVYSLSGVAPESYWVASDLISSSNALSVLIMVAAARQGVNLAKGLSAFFHKLKDRRHSVDFLKGFQGWIKGARRTGDIKTLSVLLQLHRYTILSPARFDRTRDLMTQFHGELLKLKQLGILEKFQTFVAGRQFQSRVQKFLGVLSPAEWKRIRNLNPEDSVILKTKNGTSQMRYYQSTHLEVVRWLAAAKENSTARLRSALQNRLDQKLAAEVAVTNRTLYEKLSTHVLALGGIAIGGAVGLASGVIPALDPLFPADFLSYVRNPDNAVELSVITAFYPAFALAFHEFGFLLSLYGNPRRLRIQRAQVLKNLQQTLNLIEVIERELPSHEDRVAYIRDLDGLVNGGESAPDLIERIEIATVKVRPLYCSMKLTGDSPD